MQVGVGYVVVRDDALNQANAVYRAAVCRTMVYIRMGSDSESDSVLVHIPMH